MEFEEQVGRIIKFVEEEGEDRSHQVNERSIHEATDLYNTTLKAGRHKVEQEMVKKGRALKKTAALEMVEQRRSVRLNVLVKRESLINEVFAEARYRLVAKLRDITFYRDLFRNLILEALCKCCEEEVGIRVIQRDAVLVDAVLPSAMEAFTEISGMKIRVQVDGRHFLPDRYLGGIQIFALAGCIKVENTISSRLSQVRQEFLTFARHGLFGMNPRRRFLN